VLAQRPTSALATLDGLAPLALLLSVPPAFKALAILLASALVSRDGVERHATLLFVRPPAVFVEAAQILTYAHVKLDGLVPLALQLFVRKGAFKGRVTLPMCALAIKATVALHVLLRFVRHPARMDNACLPTSALAPLDGRVLIAQPRSATLHVSTACALHPTRARAHLDGPASYAPPRSVLLAVPMDSALLQEHVLV